MAVSMAVYSPMISVNADDAITPVPAGDWGMATLTFDGHYDTLRHSPWTLTVFHEMDLPDALEFEGWRCGAVYVHDTRHPNGHVPKLSEVMDAVPVLRERITEASNRLLIWPEGRDRDGCLHVVGGGWHAAGTAVTFYVTNCCKDGRWRKYLCANL